MPELTPDQFKATLANAPAGVAPEEIVAELKARGYTVPDTSGAQVQPGVGGLGGNVAGTVGGVVGGVSDFVSRIPHPLLYGGGALLAAGAAGLGKGTLDRFRPGGGGGRGGKTVTLTAEDLSIPGLSRLKAGQEVPEAFYLRQYEHAGKSGAPVPKATRSRGRPARGAKAVAAEVAPVERAALAEVPNPGIIRTPGQSGASLQELARRATKYPPGSKLQRIAIESFADLAENAPSGATRAAAKKALEVVARGSMKGLAIGAGITGLGALADLALSPTDVAAGDFSQQQPMSLRDLQSGNFPAPHGPRNITLEELVDLFRSGAARDVTRR